jgi:hypothetical protein
MQNNLVRTKSGLEGGRRGEKDGRGEMSQGGEIGSGRVSSRRMI